MMALPDILFEDKYKETWAFEDDGWKPVANDNAPQEVKDAIDEFVATAETEEDGDDLIFP